MEFNSIIAQDVFRGEKNYGVVDAFVFNNDLSFEKVNFRGETLDDNYKGVKDIFYLLAVFPDLDGGDFIGNKSKRHLLLLLLVTD